MSTEQQGRQQVIVIAPAQPDTIYVPYYDPAVVYGPWPYPAYPPYYWPPPAYIGAGILATGLAFGAGYALGRWAAGGYWGGGFNWGGNSINVNRNVNINNIGNNNNWVHNPVHRQGVRYNNADVANKFGGNRNAGGGAQNRMDFRGRSGQQVLQPGAGRRRWQSRRQSAECRRRRWAARPGAGNLNPGGRPGGAGNIGNGARPQLGRRWRAAAAPATMRLAISAPDEQPMSRLIAAGPVLVPAAVAPLAVAGRRGWRNCPWRRRRRRTRWWGGGGGGRGGGGAEVAGAGGDRRHAQTHVEGTPKGPRLS